MEVATRKSVFREQIIDFFLSFVVNRKSKRVPTCDDMMMTVAVETSGLLFKNSVHLVFKFCLVIEGESGETFAK